MTPRTHTYAGFVYDVVDGRLIPQADQHPAAGKDRHLRAAQAEFDTGQDRLQPRRFDDRPI